MAQQVHPPEQRSTTGARRVAVAAGPFAVATTSVGDPDGTRAVTAIVALLVVIGFVLVAVAIWLFRTTRRDPEVLAPLEIMGDRGWRRADPVWQRRKLDEVRPEGAEPLQPSAAPPDFDEAFDLGPTAIGFDDLHDDRHADSDAAFPGPRGVDPTVPLPRDPIVRISTEPPVRAETPRAPDSPTIDPLLAARQHDDNGGDNDGTRTPTGIARPVPEDLPDHEVDPALLAAAMADLDAELARSRQRDVSQE